MEYTEYSNKIVFTDKDKVLAEVDFPNCGENIVDINHTFVDDSLRGKGIASELLLRTANKLKAENKKAVLSCSYANAWFEKHIEYKDLQAQ